MKVRCACSQPRRGAALNAVQVVRALLVEEMSSSHPSGLPGELACHPLALWPPGGVATCRKCRDRRQPRPPPRHIPAMPARTAACSLCAVPAGASLGRPAGSGGHVLATWRHENSCTQENETYPRECHMSRFASLQSRIALLLILVAVIAALVLLPAAPAAASSQCPSRSCLVTGAIYFNDANHDQEVGQCSCQHCTGEQTAYWQSVPACCPCT